MGRTAQPKIKIIILVGIVVIAITAGGIWVRRIWHKPAATQSAATKTSTTNTTPTSEPTSPTANTEVPSHAALVYQGQEGKTVLELLKTYAKIETKSSSPGEYVTSINGNDGGGKWHWLFYVNGKAADIGAGAYVTHDSDKIEWKLQ